VCVGVCTSACAFASVFKSREHISLLPELSLYCTCINPLGKQKPVLKKTSIQQDSPFLEASLEMALISLLTQQCQEVHKQSTLQNIVCYISPFNLR
jgi:hypothetical protein